MLACPGLDHTKRGFESFARECFQALRDRPELSIELVKGSGSSAPAETVLPVVTRRTPAARALARLLSVEPFVVEHVTFSLSLLPLLTRTRPDVVYFSEWHLGRMLAAWRAVSRQSLALVLCNGALAPGGYGHLDRVQQLVPGAIEYTAARGEPTNHQELLPLGVAIARSPTLIDDAGRARLRAALALPTDRQIVLSVGALNRQKRMDYLIEEIASMPQPRPYLLLVGQQEAETGVIRRLALERLGVGGHHIRTVSARALADHYRASDAFVLASLWESFGRVLVEAQSHGLPCLAHDHPVMNWVLGDHGTTADLTAPGGVVAWLRGLEATDLSAPKRADRHRSAHDRFSWDVLSDRYVEMLTTAARSRSAGRRSGAG